MNPAACVGRGDHQISPLLNGGIAKFHLLFPYLMDTPLVVILFLLIRYSRHISFRSPNKVMELRGVISIFLQKCYIGGLGGV